MNAGRSGCLLVCLFESVVACLEIPSLRWLCYTFIYFYTQFVVYGANILRTSYSIEIVLLIL